MTVSYSSALNTNLMELTPMRVTFNGVDLGGTLKSVIVKPQVSTAAIRADQAGETDLDYRVSGYAVTVETELVQIQDKRIWKVVFPYQKLIGSFPTQSEYFDLEIGSKALDFAANLLLHPLSKSNSDLSGDYLFYKAIADPKSQITYSPKDQGALKIIWKILPDTGTVPPRLFLFGDPSIGAVAASAGTPSFTGTGGETMGSVAVFSGVTKTETITATCLVAGATGKFDVEGSVSGPLGIATVGTNFNSAVISFLISDGSPHAVAGDVFTVATTAANYS